MFRAMRSTKLEGADYPTTGWYFDDPSTPVTVDLNAIDPVRFTEVMHGMAVSKDGTKIFAGILNPSAMLAFTLTTPGDITTILGTYTEKSMSNLTTPYWFRFNNEGTVLITSEQTGTTDPNYIYQYSLSTPWDITTLVYVKSYRYDIVGTTHQTNGVDISADGTRLYLGMYSVGDGVGYFKEYILGTPWDIGNVTFNASFESFGADFIFDISGTDLTYFSSTSNKRYIFSEPFDISSAMETDPLTYSIATNSPLNQCSTYSNATMYYMYGSESAQTLQQVNLKPEKFE